jgi:hypothetical protein
MVPISERKTATCGSGFSTITGEKRRVGPIRACGDPHAAQLRYWRRLEGPMADDSLQVAFQRSFMSFWRPGITKTGTLP